MKRFALSLLAATLVSPVFADPAPAGDITSAPAATAPADPTATAPGAPMAAPSKMHKAGKGAHMKKHKRVKAHHAAPKASAAPAAPVSPTGTGGY